MRAHPELVWFILLSGIAIVGAVAMIALSRRSAAKQIEKVSQKIGLPVTEDVREWCLPLLVQRYRWSAIGMAVGAITVWAAGAALLAAEFHPAADNNFFTLLTWAGTLVGMLLGNMLAARVSVSGIVEDGIRVANPRPRQLSDYVTQPVVRGIRVSYFSCAGSLALGLALILVHQPDLGVALCATALIVAGLVWLSVRGQQALLMRPLPASQPEDILWQDALLVEFLMPVAQHTRLLGWMTGFAAVLLAFAPQVPDWLLAAAVLLAGAYALTLLLLWNNNAEPKEPPVLRRRTSQAA
jgi:hypothetical protein